MQEYQGQRASWRNLGPNREAHNERIKLIALTVNAIGLAALLGGFIGPLLDPQKPFPLLIAAPAVVIWATGALAAYNVLGYIRSKD